MRIKLTFLARVLTMMIIGASGVFGQDASPLRAEIHAAMKRSFEQTKNSPFRITTTVEAGSSPTTPTWQTYSSWVIEVVPPDRSYFVYTSGGRKDEFLRIGTDKYRRDDYKSEWGPDETQRAHGFPNPASAVGINGSQFEYYDISSGVSATDATVYRVVKNPAAGTEDFAKKIITWTWWFNKEGILYKHDGIGYNGRNWIRTTEMYEYDPTIKIEPPVTNK